MLQKYKSYVNANKDILVDCINLPEEKFARKCNGTINIALARFNTILLHLIKYPLLAEQYSAQVEELQKTLTEFYRCYKKYITKPSWSRWITMIKLHYLGKSKIPNVRRLLKQVENEID